MGKELVIRAPEGFEFVDDGSGQPLYGCPEEGQWIFAYGPEGGGKMKAKRANGYSYTSRMTNFPLLKKKPEVIKGDVQHIPPPPKYWSVHDIYGRDVTIPEGWSYVAFRPWTPGEWFLDKFDCLPAASGVSSTTEPRIIVKKKED